MHTPKHCYQCGKKLTRKKEDGVWRHYCRSCQIHIYENPLPVVAVVCLNKKKEVLLIKRAIEPAAGKWALPSGFVELHEPAEKAALRELFEETGVRGKIKELLGVYSRSGTIYKSLITICYLVEVTGGKLKKTAETLDAGFFPLTKLKPIVFKSHRDAYREFLKRYK